MQYSNSRDLTLIKLQHTVNVLNRQHPFIKITLGYIGNINKWGDDRAWGVFAQYPHQVRPGMFGRYPTSNLDVLLSRVENGDFLDWLYGWYD